MALILNPLFPAVLHTAPPPPPICGAQEGFLAALQHMAPDLCVTAAYGNMLPQRFLDIPRLGTLNIHPSLLPKSVHVCLRMCKCCMLYYCMHSTMSNSSHACMHTCCNLLLRYSLLLVWHGSWLC